MKSIVYKKWLLIAVFLFLADVSVFAQNFGLQNTHTLYDAFENPVQTAFRADYSKKYAFNFFIPNGGTSFFFNGEQNKAIKSILFSSLVLNSSGSLGNAGTNDIYASTNTYILMYRIFKGPKYNQELGFSYQIRSEGSGKVTNETIAILDNYRLFNQTEYRDIFNNKGSNQSYHQFSVSYRENYDKKLAFGGKLSLLSGVTFNEIDIDQSSIQIKDPAINPNDLERSITVGLSGQYISSFGSGSPVFKDLMPSFKNPGLSLSLGTSYTFPGNVYVAGNLKDLGFIRWSGQTSNYLVQNQQFKVINPGDPMAEERIRTALKDLLDQNQSTKSFIRPTNARLDMLVSKTYKSYTPTFIVSKSLVKPQGTIALNNTYTTGSFHFSLNPQYDFVQGFNVGGMGMIRSANVELFLGTDGLLPAYYFSKGLATENPEIGKGPVQANVFFGFAFKFGQVVENDMNSSTISGLNDKETGYISKSERRGLFGRRRQ